MSGHSVHVRYVLHRGWKSGRSGWIWECTCGQRSEGYWAQKNARDSGLIHQRSFTEGETP